MLINYRFWSMFVSIGLLVIMAFPVMAQDTGRDQSLPGATGAQPRISDKKLENAAAAYVEIVSISQDFQESVQGVEDKSKRLELQKTANKKMVTAIEKNDLDVETYNSIIGQVRADEATRDRFMEKTQTAR